MKTVFLSLILLCLFVGTSDLPAQTVTTLHTFNGLAVNDLFGCSVAGAGDVNRDGFPDLIVGAFVASPGGLKDAGQATVFSGKDGSTLYTFNGLATGDNFGCSVAGAGDVNMDGYADLIVGARYASPGGLSSAGQATVFSGKDRSVLHTFNGIAAADQFGCSVAGAGDVNKDGYADLIVGANYTDPGGLSNAGQARVFSGKDGSTLYTFNGIAAADQFGCSVAGAGDVNKDGFSDLIVGACYASPGGLSKAGQVLVFSGKDGSVLHTFNGLAVNDLFGFSVAGAGDVDRDGFPDLIVGAFLADPSGLTDAGQATVFSGKDRSVLHTFNGLAVNDWFGASVAGAGDVNKDGFPDCIVGAWYADPGGITSAGQATVFSGKDGSVLYTFNGLAFNDIFGISVAGAGDVNRDGFPDLIVGAYGADQATVFSVVTTLISGAGSPSIGGSFILHLLAPGDGNLPYQIGTSLGTGPIPIDTRLLNLSADALLFLSVGGTVPAIFPNYSGVLDNTGNGKAALNIPNASVLVGYHIHSAFVTIKAGAPSNIKSISNTFSFVITT
jgi:FG-GAP repeat protein